MPVEDRILRLCSSAVQALDALDAYEGVELATRNRLAKRAAEQRGGRGARNAEKVR